MLLNKRFRTTFITFILLFSIFSTGISLSNHSKAQDDLSDISDLFGQDILFPHPFRVLGLWENNGNKTTIEGEIKFDLYFSSTIPAKLGLEKYKDKVNISIYKLSNQSFTPVKIKNSTKTITLEPKRSEGEIQKTKVTIKNINITLDKGDSLIFVIELLQSEKLLSSYVSKQYSKIESRLNQLGNTLNNSKISNLNDIGAAINLMMEQVDYYGIKGEDFGALVNVFISSGFYYGSTSYSSSISFSTNLSENSTVLYFQKEPDLEHDQYGFGNIKIVNETKPKNEAYSTYPPNLAGILEADEEEWLTWFMVWAMYNIVEPPVEEDENKIVYYLHQNDVMDETKPSSSNKVVRSKLATNPIEFKGPGVPRNKILKNITADLYIHYPKMLSLGKISVNVSLYNGDRIIATDEKQLDKTTLFELLKRGPDTPTTFNFETYKGNAEIIHDQNITLKVSISNKPKLSLRPVNLLYDSEGYDSSLTLIFNETDNIKLGDIGDKKIYAGGSAEYNIEVSSEYADKLTLEISGAGSGWKIDYPSSISIGANSTETIKVYVNSTATSSNAYGETANLTFNITGKTGFDSKKANVKISEEAVEYDIEIIPKFESLEVKHGENKTYSFIVRNRNKGYLEDTYSISLESEHGFDLEFNNPFNVNDLIDVYNNNTKVETILNVTVKVPWYTTIKSDKLTLTLTSFQSGRYGKNFSKSITVTTKIITPSIFESIYHSFESAAYTLGIDNLLGDYAAVSLIILTLLIILIVVLVLWLLFKRKFVELICLDRIKEIKPDQTAEFNITLRNPCKRIQTYEIKTEIKSDPKKWDVSLDCNNVTIDSKQSRDIKLIVKPTDFVRPDDWVEVRVIARPIDRAKTTEISTMTSIKESKLKLDITGVVHWPKIFKKGDRVETSFRLINRGDVAAENVTVALYVNGKEKNKVDNITIPRGGYADIEIPWIAEKGKNEVNIVVK